MFLVKVHITCYTLPIDHHTCEYQIFLTLQLHTLVGDICVRWNSSTLITISHFPTEAVFQFKDFKLTTLQFS